ncbi:MAG: hypothetical protein AAGJ28_21505, partial [Pseudomonadota bacterium]
MAVNAVYAALFEKSINRLELHTPTTTHANGPFYPNISGIIKPAHAIAIAAKESRIRLYSNQP